MQTKNLTMLLTPFLLVGCINQEEKEVTTLPEEPVVEEVKEEKPKKEANLNITNLLAEASLNINEYFNSSSSDTHYGRVPETQVTVGADDIYQLLERPDFPASGNCFYYGFTDNGEDYFLAITQNEEVNTIGTNIGITNAKEYKTLISEPKESCTNVVLEIPGFTAFSVAERELEQ